MIESTIKHQDKQPFSVLMSIYAKEDASYFEQSVESVVNQTVQPDEIVIVQDGPLTEVLYDMCDALKSRFPCIRYLRLEQNSGLGIALQQGVLACRNEIIARMDTDDIAVPDRFEKQLQAFRMDSLLVVCGGYIEEFDKNPERRETIRKVPEREDEIYRYAKKRNPFNHMTVMFRKSAVLAAGNYQPFLLLEDYYLWFRMIQKGYEMRNLPETLVWVRAGSDMTGRRGGYDYFKREQQLYQVFKQSGYLTEREYLIICFIRFCVRIAPNWLRTAFYQVFLR